MADLTIGSAASLQFAIDARQTLTAIGPSRGPGAPEGRTPSALNLVRNGGTTGFLPRGSLINQTG